MSSLSLLSRGNGQVVRKKQEKLEVRFDPEDYLNWKPSETHCHVSRLLGNGQVLEGYWELYLPKTYSTKTGALVLYSEDVAKRSRKLKGYERPQQRRGNKSKTLHLELYTLQDLVRAILAYGGKQLYVTCFARPLCENGIQITLKSPFLSGIGSTHRGVNVQCAASDHFVCAASTGGSIELWKNKQGIPWQPYLHFLRDPEAIQAGRQMRPGYSAKRYLLKLSQTLNPSILQKLQCAGYIRDPLLLEKNSSSDRAKQQDLSAVPPKYNLHVLCSPCSYLPTEFEQPTNPDLDPSSHKRSGTEAWVLGGYKEETWARRRAPVPLRLSVRKLSFQRTPQHSKETTWSQNAAYKGVPEDTCMEVPQDGGNAKEDQGHHKMPNRSLDCSSLENTSMDTSELWCEKSHVTFYGGFFSGRKISCSVGQKHPKNPDCRERGAPVETGLFPPVHPRRSSGQDGERKELRKQLPEMVRLPQIPEDSPRAQREKLKSSELSKELVVLPLLIRLEREPQIRAKKPAGACCNKVKSEVTLGDKLLAPLLNDLISEPEHRNKQHQIINGGIPEAPSGTDLFIQDAVPSIGLLPTIDPNKYPGTQSNRDNFKPSTVINAGSDKDFPAGIPHQEWRGPDGEIVCPVLLGSVQTADDLGHWGFIPDEEDDGEVSLERRTVSINPPRTSAVAQERDRKSRRRSGTLIPILFHGVEETLKTQTGQVQETKKGLGDEHHRMGSESTSAEFKQGTQQRQDGDDSNSQWPQSKQKKRHSSLQPRGRTGQKDGGDFTQDAGKQLDTLPQSETLSRLEPSLDHMIISSSHMERVPVPESEDGNLTEMPSHSEAIQENTRTGLHSSKEVLETEEVEQMTLPEKTSKQAKATRLHADRDVSENKPTSKQEKYELAKTGAVAKPPKKSPKKDKRPSQAEFVVGKPHQKKAAAKRASNRKVKPAGVNIPVIPEEPSQEEKGDAEVEEKLTTCLGGGELGGPAGQSPSPSCSLKEEPSSPLEEGLPPSADGGHASRSQACPAQEMLHVSQPAVSDTSSPQTGAILSSETPQVLLQNKEEEKRSRDKLIAERAEQRRLAVEKKRREKEELKRKQQEEKERMERMKEEMEEEQQRRLEEMRLRRQQREEELQRQEEEAARMFKAERAAQERVRQQQEEQRRKLLEMQKKRQQEEKERAEAEKRRQKEREMQLEEERRLLAEMAEEERLAFKKRKQEEEEEVRRLAEERRKKAEEEAKLALEEAKKQAVLLARQRAELEEKQRVQYKLFVEATGLEQGQTISRPWVYSYFQHPFLKMGDDD